MAQKLRVAVIGVGHYHAQHPPFYLDLLQKHGAAVVAVADPSGPVAQAAARGCDATAYVDYRSMVQLTRPDLVLALGRHADMPEAFRYLVDAGVPFIAEKPWGTDAETVRQLAALAESRGAWVATPFAMRYSPWADAAQQLIKTGEGGVTSHIVFRMIRPGVQRYIDYGSPWMLSKREAGGGVLLNLGVHGFDLCRYLTGEEPEIVSSVVSNAAHGLEVEDYAAVVLRTPSGIVFHNQVGYTFPWLDSSDDELTLAAANTWINVSSRGVTSGDMSGGMLVVRTGEGGDLVPPPPNFFYGWDGFIVNCLSSLRRGEPPPNSPRDTARAVALVFEAYRIAGVA